MQIAASDNISPVTLLEPHRVPATMLAAVYTGSQTIAVQTVPVPAIAPGELLVQVQSCGICHTDLKKIEYDLLPAPRIFGHETAGVVVAAGRAVSGFVPGDRVAAFHHIPCLHCFYCSRKLYAQCPTYKQVGITAGFEPAGGGFAQYVRVMDWIVARGLERIPPHVSFDAASFVEPVNTVLKGVVQAGVQPGDTALVLGQGPIGLLFTLLLRRAGARVLVSDTLLRRRELAGEFGAEASLDPFQDDVPARCLAATENRGADLVVVATSAPGLVEQAVRASRPGSKILLFSQTSKKERIEVAGADICMGERTLFGSYSASVDLQKEAATLVFSGLLPVERLVSHRFALDEIQQGIELARLPSERSLKIIVHPQRWS